MKVRKYRKYQNPYKNSEVLVPFKFTSWNGIVCQQFPSIMDELKRSLHYSVSKIVCGLREDLASAATASQVKYVIS